MIVTGDILDHLSFCSSVRLKYDGISRLGKKIAMAEIPIKIVMLLEKVCPNNCFWKNQIIVW